MKADGLTGQAGAARIPSCVAGREPAEYACGAGRVAFGSGEPGAGCHAAAAGQDEESRVHTDQGARAPETELTVSRLGTTPVPSSEASLPMREAFAPGRALGCHRRRIPNPAVFEHIVLALVHGSGCEGIGPRRLGSRHPMTRQALGRPGRSAIAGPPGELRSLIT